MVFGRRILDPVSTYESKWNPVKRVTDPIDNHWKELSLLEKEELFSLDLEHRIDKLNEYNNRGFDVREILHQVYRELENETE